MEFAAASRFDESFEALNLNARGWYELFRLELMNYQENQGQAQPRTSGGGGFTTQMSMPSIDTFTAGGAGMDTF